MVSSRNPTIHRSPRLLLRASIALAALTTVMAGCKEADEIRQYQVDRVEREPLQFLPPQYELPLGWIKQPRNKSQFARFKDTFRVGEGATAAEASVSAMRSRGKLLDDINRWRDEVKVEPIHELPKDVQEINAAGKECEYVDLTGPSKRTLAVILPREDYIWYFKIIGPTERVTGQKSAFEKWVRSVSFSDG